MSASCAELRTFPGASPAPRPHTPLTSPRGSNEIMEHSHSVPRDSLVSQDSLRMAASTPLKFSQIGLRQAASAPQDSQNPGRHSYPSLPDWQEENRVDHSVSATGSTSGNLLTAPSIVLSEIYASSAQLSEEHALEANDAVTKMKSTRSTVVFEEPQDAVSKLKSTASTASARRKRSILSLASRQTDLKLEVPDEWRELVRGTPAGIVAGYFGTKTFHACLPTGSFGNGSSGKASDPAGSFTVNDCRDLAEARKSARQSFRHSLSNGSIAPLSKTFSKTLSKVSSSVSDMVKRQEVKEMYHLSKPVSVIEDFISHSWGAPHWQKYVSLLLLYNSLQALVFSVVASAATGTLFYLKFLPVMTRVTHCSEGVEYTYPFSPWCVIVGSIVYLLVLLRLQSLVQLLRISRMVFFDRICICQTDRELKRNGIQSIGAFMATSRRMVILWSSDYLTRLWCVYEVAVFNHINLGSGSQDLYFVPLPAAQLVTYGCFVTFTCNILYNMLSAFDTSTQLTSAGMGCDQRWPVLLLLFPSFLFSRRLARRYLKVRLDMKSQFESFSVQNSYVRVQRDRALISRSIGKMFAPDQKNKDIGIDRFNVAVRGRFKDSILRSVGSELHMPYRYVACIGVPAIWGHFDYLAGYVGHLSREEVIGSGILYCVLGLCIIPVGIKIMLWLSLWSAKNALCLFVIDVLITILLLVVFMVNYSLIKAAATKLVYAVPTSIFWILLCVYFFHRPGRRGCGKGVGRATNLPVLQELYTTENDDSDDEKREDCDGGLAEFDLARTTNSTFGVGKG